MRRTFHALLAGGVLVFSAGCKKPIRIFWPTGPERSAHVAEGSQEEIRVPDLAAQEPAPEDGQPRWEPFIPVKDEATEGFVELGLGRETGPAGAPNADLPNVEFGFDSAELSPEGRALLDKAAAYMTANPKVNIVLRGHTDPQGTEEYNLALGSRRAQAVRDYLIGKGIRPNRMETVSFGKMLPVEATDGKVSAVRSRRVEFFLYTVED